MGVESSLSAAVATVRPVHDGTENLQLSLTQDEPPKGTGSAKTGTMGER
jgi:hypothetical protein